VWGWGERQVMARQPGVIHATMNHLRLELGSAAGEIFVRKCMGVGFATP
jgi:hypothetical protein